MRDPRARRARDEVTRADRMLLRAEKQRPGARQHDEVLLLRRMAARRRAELPGRHRDDVNAPRLGTQVVPDAVDVTRFAGASLDIVPVHGRRHASTIIRT